jgi:hypothetical protein
MRLAHRVRTRASPAQVWEVLGDPRRWSEFEPALRGVRGRPGAVSTGQRLIGLSRVAALGIPLDVLEVTPHSRVVLLVHALPGLREQVTYEVTPAARGGSDVVVSVVVDGPLGWPSVVPLFLASGLTARLLARRTDRIARAARRVA